jgi:hypothetical protein
VPEPRIEQIVKGGGIALIAIRVHADEIERRPVDVFPEPGGVGDGARER